MPKPFLSLIAWALLCTALPLAAQSPLPAPAEQYLDEDAAAVMPEEIGPNDRRARETLEQIMQYDPENVPARVQHGFHLVLRGLNRRAEQEFEYAIRVAGEGSLQQRHAHWGYGWALYRMGQPRRAIEQFQRAAALHGGQPSWLPWSMGIALWTAGDSALALDYWRAAVRSDPERWGSTRGLERETRDWPANQRLAAEALHAEWKRQVTEG